MASEKKREKVVGPASFRDRGLAEKEFLFEQQLKDAMPTRNQSDRTCVRNVGRFLQRECKKGEFDENVIFFRVLDRAREIEVDRKTGQIKNGWAVFMAMMRKEFNYERSRG